jgi:hypothetical protein
MFESPGSKVVALPFPFEPRRVKFGDSAKVLDFIAWKIAHMPKTNGEANGNNKSRKTKEELAAMSRAEKKLYVLKRMLNAIDTADDDDIQRILEILDASNGEAS